MMFLLDIGIFGDSLRHSVYRWHGSHLRGGIIPALYWANDETVGLSLKVIDTCLRSFNSEQRTRILQLVTLTDYSQ